MELKIDWRPIPHKCRHCNGDLEANLISYTKWGVAVFSYRHVASKQSSCEPQSAEPYTTWEVAEAYFSPPREED